MDSLLSRQPKGCALAYYVGSGKVFHVRALVRRSLQTSPQSPPNGAPVGPGPKPFPPLPVGVPVVLVLPMPALCTQFQLMPEQVHVVLS